MQAAQLQARATRPAVARRTTVRVQAQQAAPRAQAPKPQQFAAGLAAAFVAVTLVLAPAANAAESRPPVKSVVCASNPTSKVCLKDSAKN
jgi:hypothetical protein